jgi:malonyl CoA-acyl carrier protein transacylase
MRDAAVEYAGTLADAKLASPKIPVIANVSAAPYDPAVVRETLGRQIDHSVRWLDSMLYLLDHGVTAFEETGPGTVLAKLAAQIRKRRGA